MYQGTILNQTRIPVKREQVQPGPVVQANGAVQTDNTDRIDALEAALAAALALIAGHESRIDALELTIIDHESRIAALEP